MLAAQKSYWFERVFSIYNRNLFRQRFSSLKVAGLERLRERDKSVPLVLYANHSSWWDGLVSFEIGRTAQLDHFVMMEEKQLEKLFLFRRLGAFSVNKEKQREILKSLDYAVNLLKEKPNRALWIFPQGEILPNDARPLKFYNGLKRIIVKTGKCFAAPVAMRYEFLGDFKPEAFARIGELKLVNQINIDKRTNEQLAANLTVELDDLKADILYGRIGIYENLIKRDRRN